MARRVIIVPLVLLLNVSPILLNVSPILPLFAEFICCCDGPPHHQEDARHDHDHTARPAPTEPSYHSDNDGEDRHGSHHGHGVDDTSGTNLPASAELSSFAPNSCSCDQADLPKPQALAISQLSKKSRKSNEMASGHLVSALRVAEDRPYRGAYTIGAGNVSVSVSHLFLLNRTLLI